MVILVNASLFPLKIAITRLSGLTRVALGTTETLDITVLQNLTKAGLKINKSGFKKL